MLAQQSEGVNNRVYNIVALPLITIDFALQAKQ